MSKDGIHPRLLAVISAVNDWCQQNGVQYDIACDESDIQGIKLFQKNRTLINNLFEHITPFLEKNGIHLEHEKVRGGTIIAFSLEALSEQKMRGIITGIGEEIETMTFQDRIADAIARKPVPKVVQESPKPKSKDELRYSFLKTAIGLVEGKKDDDDRCRCGRNRCQHTGLVEGNDNKGSEKTREGITKTSQSSRGATKGHALQFEHKINGAFGIKSRKTRGLFNSHLQEALGGIATPTGAQPQDLFAKFARALRVLGDQMGTGPLQDLLKSQGINWKKSDDGGSIILYIVNAQTNAPQPIARVSAETLENPSDFEEQLTHMLDFAKGDAPGAFKQRQQEIKNQEKAVRDIARAVSPQDRESEVAKQMNSDMPTQDAGVQAATVAASPKPGMTAV